MDKFHIKSQVALQFLIIIGVLLFVFIVFLGMISSDSSEQAQQKLSVQAQDIINALQKELVVASTVLDGYNRQFYIPAKIGSYDYSIYIEMPKNTTLVLTLLDSDYTKRIPPINGQPKPGYNNVSKSGGVVYLN